VCGAVAGLLAAHERADGPLDRPAPGALRGPERPPPDAPVDRVGPYRVVREIGRGGMGTVYLASATTGSSRSASRSRCCGPALDAADLVQRFVAERQILATLDHPNVARLLDGGAAADGRPFYVMEYVEGDAIDVYCDQRRLPVRARLRLLCTVARAVHYAHRNLVVHRDLKPSNVLVTHAGEVKLLDFGIAKLLDPDAALAGDVPLTRTGLRMMTPEYASPEQVRGDPVTTATDVYGLGLVLYELLTGRRAHQVGTRAARDLERVVCEVEPPRPSWVVTHVPAADDAAAPAVHARRAGPRRRASPAPCAGTSIGSWPARCARSPTGGTPPPSSSRSTSSGT
jgi:serine/threonine-protein kinase